ncbi:MAG TPA: lipopolysaccharide biosynthesis protein, partial [Chryseosolibacter sp.]
METESSQPSKGLLQRTFRGFFWVLLGSGVQAVLKTGVVAVLARLVTPGEFGLMGIAFVVLEFSKMFTQMGVGPALVQRTEIETRHLTTGLTLSLMIGAFFSLLLLVTAPFVALFFRMPGLTNILRVLSIVFLINSFTIIAQALMQRNMKFRINSAIEVGSYAIGYGLVGIVLAYLGLGVWSLVFASLAQAIVLTAFLLSVQPFPKKLGFDRTAFRDLLFFGGGFTLARIANFLALQGDNLVVGRLLGARLLGIYGRAYQFMVMPAGLFGNALDKALFPAMAKVQSDQTRVSRAYLTGVSIIALVAIPLSFLSYLLAPEIVMVMLGPEWGEVITPFQILACSLLFRMSYKMSDSLCRATGAVYRRAWRQVIYAAMVLTGSWIGQFWGLPGVAWGVAASLVGNFLLMAQLSLQLTDVTWYQIAQAHKPGILLGLIAGLACQAVVSLCRGNNIPDLLTIFLAATGVGMALLLALLSFPGLFISSHLKE